MSYFIGGGDTLCPKKYMAGDPLYLALQDKLDSLYESIAGDDRPTLVEPDSQLMRGLSEAWREYILGLGMVFITDYSDEKGRVSVPNPLYTEPEEFKYIDMDEEIAKKILVIGMP